ncbi:MAG: homoserine/homoserine lactone efflux protein [Phenylobacterium sp.]|jgi:homoserine/homoserine lactone efflux protein
MIDLANLALFIPTFFLVSISPGMCMTLALTMGMTVGFRQTMWMMAGELVGVGLVGIFAVVGVATMMLQYPSFFVVFKYAGGLYLGYIGVQMWLSKGKMALTLNADEPVQRKAKMAMATQGFVTAIANPKGWAFMISLLPPFVNASMPLAPQLAVLLGTVLVLETICMMLYAAGGKQLGRLLTGGNNVAVLNKITGTLMIGVGIWLAFG